MKQCFRKAATVLALIIAISVLSMFAVSHAESSAADFVGEWKEDYGDAYALYAFYDDGSLSINFHTTEEPESSFGYNGTWSVQDGILTMTYIITYYSMPDETQTVSVAADVSGDVMTIFYEDGMSSTLHRTGAAEKSLYCDHAKSGLLFIAYTDEAGKVVPSGVSDGSIPLSIKFAQGTSYHPGSSENMLSILSGGMQIVAACHGMAESPVSIENTEIMAEKAAARYGGNYQVSYSSSGNGFVQAVYSGIYPTGGAEYPYLGIMLALESELQYFSLECINTSAVADADFKVQFLSLLDSLTYKGENLILGDRRTYFDMIGYSMLMPDGWAPIALSPTEANVNGKGYIRFYEYSEFTAGILRTALDQNGGYENMNPNDVIQAYIDSSSIAQYDPYTDLIRKDITFTNGQACVILAGKNLSGLGGCSAYAVLANGQGILLIAHQYPSDHDAAIEALVSIVENTISRGEQLIISTDEQKVEPVEYDDAYFYW